MKLTADQKTQFEQALLKQLDIRVDGNNAEYKYFVISKTSQGLYNLYDNKGDQDLGNFYLRITSLMAAKKYEKHKITDFNLIKIMDYTYGNLQTDIEIFKHQLKRTNDPVKKDNLSARLQECFIRSRYYKERLERDYKASIV